MVSAHTQMHTDTNKHLCPRNKTNCAVTEKSADRKCLTDRIIVVLFSPSKAVIQKAQGCERLKVATVMLQWVVIDRNGCSKLYNECEVMGS